MKELFMQKQKKLFIIISVFLGALFFFGVCHKGYVLCADTSSYLEMNYSREPFYPLFLAFFRFVFGEAVFLHVIWILQVILAIFSTTYFIYVLMNQFHLHTITGLFLLLCTWIPYSLDGFYNRSLIFKTNEILTEGITQSLLYLVIIFCFQSIFYGKKAMKYFLLASIVTLVAVLTRSQMFVLLGILLVTALYSFIQSSKRSRLILQLFLLLCVILSATWIKSVYEKHCIVIPEGYTASYPSRLMLFTNLMFASDNEDALLFDDSELQFVYQNLYSQMDALGYTHQYASGFFDTESLLHEAHDVIKYDLFANTLQQDTVTMSSAQIIDHMIPILMKNSSKQWLYDCFSAVPKSFVRSIFFASASHWGLCAVYSATCYLSALALIFLCFKKRKNSPAGFLLLLTLLTISGNVAGVSLIMYALTRYLIYCFGLFYLSIILAVRELLKSK